MKRIACMILGPVMRSGPVLKILSPSTKAIAIQNQASTLFGLLNCTEMVMMECILDRDSHFELFKVQNHISTSVSTCAVLPLMCSK
jgi:hypothetical protein